MSLSKRQSEILKAIIEEYVDKAQPIASVHLVQSRNFNVCGATIRNVMSDLVKKGYLQMVHISSGRQPTELAYRYYITELMNEEDVDVLAEVALKQKIWQKRYDLERLLSDAAKGLSDTTDIMAFAMSNDGYLGYSGVSKLLDNPEFFEIESIRAILRFVEDYDLSYSILSRAVSKEGVTVLIGREIGLANVENTTIIVCYVNLGKTDGYVGAVGPSRLSYGRIIPLVRRSAKMIEEVISEI